MSFKIIGYIGKSLGLEGKFYLTEPKLDAEALRSLKYVYVGNGVEPDEVHALLSVEERNSRLCISLEGIESKEAAIRLTHSALFITDKQAALFPEFEEELDIEGYKVFENGVQIGEVKEIQELPGQDMIIFIAMDGSTVMLPYVEEFIEKIDDEQGILHVQLLEGMMDDH